MSRVSLNPKNRKKPAPRWFRKLKSALGYLVDGAIVIMLATGHSENSMGMLIARVGYSRVINAIEALLANGDDYVSNQTS